MHLCLFAYPSGHHQGAWRTARPGGTDDVYTLDYYRNLAVAAERAKFDAVFLADAPVLPDTIEYTTSARLEPVAVLSALAGATSRIGLIATVSTTYTEPYNTARALATLDHLSSGRAGWNIVTTGSAAAAANFGELPHPDPARRYARATEFVDVVTGLWRGWEPGAVLADDTSGKYAEPTRIHPLHHRGEHFQVRGPLNIPRPPQGSPVLVQAGASAAGRHFAAQYAEVIFTAQQDICGAGEFRAQIRAQAAILGRPAPKVLAGLCPIVAATEDEALAIRAELDSLAPAAAGLSHLRSAFGIDLTDRNLDETADPRWFTDTGDHNNASKSRLRLLADQVRREQPTLRQLLSVLTTARAHLTLVGSAIQVATTMRQWVDDHAVDGFVIMPAQFPSGLTAFAQLVVPKLQEWGLFRHDYSGSTLRKHFHLERTGATQCHN